MDSMGFHEAFNVRVEELQVLDMQFLYGCARPTVALLFQDNKNARHLRTYEISLKDKVSSLLHCMVVGKGTHCRHTGSVAPVCREGALLCLAPVTRPCCCSLSHQLTTTSCINNSAHLDQSNGSYPAGLTWPVPEQDAKWCSTAGAGGGAIQPEQPGPRGQPDHCSAGAPGGRHCGGAVHDCLHQEEALCG